MKEIKGGVNAPKGFASYGLHCGVKRKRKDLALIVSEESCVYAGVFTRNIVKAAPVVWNQNIALRKNNIKGIIINSGIANACTGEQGYEDAKEMAMITADSIGAKSEEVLVASTGIIGQMLPMEAITKGIKEIGTKIGTSNEDAKFAAEAIMTTDTFSKEIAVEMELNGKKVRIGGMAKGSGMIHPNMGTMLGFITTDVTISQSVLYTLLKETVDDSYNMISVDGDTSTNDMVLVLANGKSDSVKIIPGTVEYEVFKEAFLYVNKELSKMIVKDGEGATKFIEVEIRGMKNESEAKKMAKAVITSNLVKTAFFGEDANWGRILCALGYSKADFDPAKIVLTYHGKNKKIRLIENGEPIVFDENKASEILKEKEIKVVVDCYQGEAKAVGWGCDLSYDYVKINGEYRT